MIASVRGKAKGDTTRRRRAPIRILTAVLAAAAFALGATSAMADPSAPVIDPAQTSPVVVDPTAGSIDPAAATTLTPVDPTQVPPGPVAPPVDPAAIPVANVPPPVDPAATPLPAVTPPPAPPADPAPDQLSPGLLAQVNNAAIDQAAPSKPSADIPPAITPTRTTADAVGSSLAAKPATPPPIGDVPPATLVNARKGVPLVPSLVPVATAGTERAAAAAHREATVTRAGPVWHQFIWRDAGTGTDSTNLGTRALLAIIGILPFAPVDGPDRSVPPASQLALLIPVLVLAGFLFATRPIDEPRRRAPHRYRAVALKPG